jgi:hypothetical protein
LCSSELSPPTTFFCVLTIFYLSIKLRFLSAFCARVKTNNRVNFFSFT